MLLNLVAKVIPKKLWIARVIHAETVTRDVVIHAETVTPLRRNGDAPNKEPVVPVINAPVVGAAPFGDKSATCPPTGLHLLSTASF